MDRRRLLSESTAIGRAGQRGRLAEILDALGVWTLRAPQGLAMLPFRFSAPAGTRERGMKQLEPRWNVPNVLSAYRLAVIPVILGAILLGRRNTFFILICLSLVTDILDGWIARRFHLETEFGARLDSLADDLTSFIAFVGFVVLEHEFVWEHRAAFGLLLGVKLIPLPVSLWRFGRSTSLHLYSSKIAAYLQGILVFTYFVAGYSAWYFYLTIGFSVLASGEKLVVLLIIPEPRSNLRGLYWVLEDKRSGA